MRFPEPWPTLARNSGPVCSGKRKWAEILKLEAEAEPEIEVQEAVYNPTRIYLQEIGRVHLLSTADEKVLSKKTASGLTALPDNVTL